jgi:hypothetical protein
MRKRDSLYAFAVKVFAFGPGVIECMRVRVRGE